LGHKSERATDILPRRKAWRLHHRGLIESIGMSSQSVGRDPGARYPWRVRENVETALA
jgi:hypothetical protein